MLWFISLWDGLVVTWSGQISSGCLVDSFRLSGDSIGLMYSAITYAVLQVCLGWIGGYFVGSDIFGLFGRFSWVVSWFNRSCVFYYTISVLRFSLGCIDGYLVGQISSGCLVDSFALLAGSNVLLRVLWLTQ